MNNNKIIGFVGMFGSLIMSEVGNERLDLIWLCMAGAYFGLYIYESFKDKSE